MSCSGRVLKKFVVTARAPNLLRHLEEFAFLLGSKFDLTFLLSCTGRALENNFFPCSGADFIVFFWLLLFDCFAVGGIHFPAGARFDLGVLLSMSCSIRPLENLFFLFGRHIY